MTTPAPIEIRWLWRRIVTIGVLIVAHLIVAAVVWKTSDGAALKWIALASILEASLAHTAYLSGATVTDWAKVIAAARGVKENTP